MTICHFCGSKSVSQYEEIECYKYKDKKYSVPIDFSTCDSCDEEFITAVQIRKNEIRIREAKKELDGLLSNDEIYNIRKHFGLTQLDAAIIFGGGKNAFSKYERSEVTQSTAMDKLIRLAVENSFVFKKLLDMAGFSVEESQGIRITYDISSIETTSLKSSPFTSDPSNIIQFEKYAA